MTTHLGVMILFAACVSTVFGVLQRDVPREQLTFGGKVFGVLVVGAYVLAWVMHLAF